jgi:hypothetical protein
VDNWNLVKMRGYFEKGMDVFRMEGRIHWPLFILFILINLIVMMNAILHPSGIGYDADQHLSYIKSLSAGYLPTPLDSKEYFSPPLAYLFPAAVTRIFSLDMLNSAKIAQFINVIISILSTFILLKICDLILPGNISFKLGSLGFLGIIPVYYKTFAFIRGEPFIVLFSLLMTYFALKIFITKKLTTGNIIALGIAFGLVALSRQWGLLTIPAVIGIALLEIIRYGNKRNQFIYGLLVSLMIGALIGGWFYLNLKIKYGSFTAFNKNAKTTFELSNQPLDFYFGLGLDELFTNPFRKSFTNQLLPVLYSETWGDYWGYFVVIGIDARTDDWIVGPNLSMALEDNPRPNWLISNHDKVVPYLGRVNIIGLFPTILMLIATIYSVYEAIRYLLKNHDQKIAGSITLILIIIVTSLAGYLWFLIMYPSPVKGDTIKASYILQIFPFISILVGFLLQRINQRSRVLFTVLMIALALVFLHNLPVLITHYYAYSELLCDLIFY